MADVFQFRSSASLVMLTGRKAHNLEQFLELIETCSGSSIFFHTFSAFFKMRDAHVPFNTDFAMWTATMLNEKALAEKLMAIDLWEQTTVESLRSQLLELLKNYRKESPRAFEKTAEEPLYLHDMARVVYLTDRFAYDLKTFRDVLLTVSINSIYFHFVESRLESGLETNDFSVWVEHSLEMPELADRIGKIDLSVFTPEGLRGRILELIDDYLKEIGQ